MSDAATVINALDQAGRPLDDYGIQKFARHKLGAYMTPSSARSRRAELVRSGLVVPAGTSVSPTGRKCTTWRLKARPNRSF